MSDIWNETLVVYKHTCKKTKKSYVGCVWRQTLRQRVHHHGTGYKLKTQPLMFAAIYEHGWDSFETEILAYCEDKDECFKLEREMIHAFDTICPNGYNIQEGGQKGRPCAEICRKISKNSKEAHKRKREAKGAIDGETKICWSKPELCPFKGQPQPVANFGKCRDKRGNNYDGLQDKCFTCNRARCRDAYKKRKFKAKKLELHQEIMKENGDKTVDELKEVIENDPRMQKLEKDLYESLEHVVKK